jgi:hypothetical protein
MQRRRKFQLSTVLNFIHGLKISTSKAITLGAVIIVHLAGVPLPDVEPAKYLGHTLSIDGSS